MTRLTKAGPLTRAVLSAVILCATSGVSQAGTILDSYSGYAATSSYNAYILEDITDYSTQGVNQTDIEGPVAVAGNVEATGGASPSLTVGYKMSLQPGYDGSQYGLVVGGNLENTSNTQFGSTWVGGNATLGSGLTVEGNLIVGGNLDYNSGGTGGQIGQAINDNGGSAEVLVGGDATFGHGSNVFGSVESGGNIVVNGDGFGDTASFSATGTFTHNNATPYLESRATEGAPAPTLPAAPVDFVAVNDAVKADSLAMAGLEANAAVQENVAGHAGVYLDTATSTAASGDVIVFDLGVDLADLWSDGFTIASDHNVEIIINVAGGTHTITNFAFDVAPSLDITNIVFNFFEATALYLGAEDDSSGIAFIGNILAPLADVIFYNGHLDGNLVAKSLTGDGQINWIEPQGSQSVPAPSVLALMLAGLFLLMRLERARRQH